MMVRTTIRRGVLRPFLVLTLVIGLPQLVGCVLPGMGSRFIDIIVENQTDQVLTIYYREGGNPEGTIAPGQQLVMKDSLDAGRYPIVAANSEGKIVFSGTYTRYPSDKYHLIETDIKHPGVVKVYKAVIPPLTAKNEQGSG